nr:copia protein [Tanacetum cinerariifolium]
MQRVSSLANAEIFDGLAKMGYEKLSKKLTFYKAFFSPQWKFLIHTILYLVKNIEAGVSFFMFPRFMQLLIDHQLGDMSHHKEIYDNPSLIKKVFANIKRVGTGFSRVVTPLFENMLVPATEEVESKVVDIKSTYQERIEKLKGRVDRLEEEIRVLKELYSIHFKVDTAAPVMEKEKSFRQGRIIADIDEDVSVLRKRRCVVIQDPEETTSTIVVQEFQSKDKGNELNADINWNAIIKQVKRSERLNDAVMKYQALKRKPLTEAQEVNEEVTLLEKEVEVESHEREGESLEKEITKKQKMDEEVEELRSHLQIVSNEDDGVYTEATPLASKIPIVDYKIHFKRNKPYFKIIRADGNHMLFLSFSTLLKNFDREDLESLWKLVKERFEKTELKNYSDDYLLKTLKIMFEQPDVEASVWRDQNGRYPLTHFTLEQMLNNVRLEVEEESEMSLELLRLVRRQLNEGGGLLGIMDFNILLLLFILSAASWNYCCESSSSSPLESEEIDSAQFEAVLSDKGERKSIALKANKESSDKECSTSGSKDQEYAMAVRDLKKFFKRRESALDVEIQIIIGECLKPPKDKNERAFFVGSWSDSGEEDDICLGVDLEPDEWIKDSGFSKHMTGNQKLFSTYKVYNGGNVIFGSYLRGNIIGKVNDGKVICRGIRKKGLYVMKLGTKPEGKIYLATIDENSTLWHRRLGHANMRLIQSLVSKELVRNLPKLKFDQQYCDACKIGKQAHDSHKAKNIVITTRCLELIHIDLFGPFDVRSYGGNLYTLVIVDDYSRFNETLPPSKTSTLVDDDLDEEEAIRITEKKNLENDIENETLEIDKVVNIKVYRNKLDENGVVSQNKDRLVVQGYNQQEGIDYDETYAQVARLESIRILLAYAWSLDFKLFQMDAKSTFLNGFINEEIHVAQPSGFIDNESHIMFINSRKLYMVLNKHPKLGLID